MTSRQDNSCVGLSVVFEFRVLEATSFFDRVTVYDTFFLSKHHFV